MFQKLFWPFTVPIDCSCEVENVCKLGAEGQEFAKGFPLSLEQVYVTAG